MSFGQGGPSWGGPEGQQSPQDPYGTHTAPDTPDWAALADASAARARRKRWMYIGGGVLATAVVGAIVATAVVTTNSGTNTDNTNSASELPTPETLPTESAQPGPSFSSQAPPPPPNPRDFISSAKKDTLPLSADSLFPGKKLKMGDRAYAKGATNTTTSCSAATQGALGGVLANNGCDQVIRATYSKDGVAVTVGVAVFDTAAQAAKAKEQASGGLASLPGGGVPTFCRGGSVCLRTANAYGRYAYFTVSGFTSGKNATTADKDVYTTSDDLAEFTFRQIHQRGKTQASAAAVAGQ
ncbi:hypothetical protein AR457_14600 [Streptomyces agglomeratus]|uniref:Uncharacterized protein n=1 Tax=Streptomyces agglomeratus TaxID=285458 RepID=A0A1E5P7R2_9ACTN|nr:hypothetical protein [Streptomyces agglomeratus]OEJ25507.1 hypothetical protein AS594_14415 [Streptomyces agglomeratus]OEJ42533.1 hypothetical protein BGK70_22055 [Streptomyces agglomeratus]OEJ45167.1 hypothetical protein AR457_14600 [Streptomyces agglomeratus]OEJ55852.1 hypothetical protein BGK72_21695 [Streptomyces agglomeratus]OEJ63233.1 hypothetical protein BGM19_22400 [Streptomyces agglomeratus]